MSHGDSPASRMVDVGEKPLTSRRAVAEGWVMMGPHAHAAFERACARDASLLETARVAGIMAGKRTSDLLPLCHPIGMDHLSIDFESRPEGLLIRSIAATRAATGVEMEALTAVSVTGLAIIAALEREAEVPGRAPAPDGGEDAPAVLAGLDGIRLVEKSGGRSGDYRAPDAGAERPSR